MVSRTGTCTCGALKVTTEGEPSLVLVCNCTLCQRRTGSVFGVSAYFPKDTVTVSGQAKRFTRGSDSGRKGRCYFCAECGTTLYWDAESRPNLRGVAVGCFAGPAFPGPQQVNWTEHQHPWVRFPDGLPHNRKGAPAQRSPGQ